MMSTAKLSLQFYHFFVIYGGFYKITGFKPTSTDPVYKTAPAVLQPGPSKDPDVHKYTLGGSGELSGGSPTAGLGRVSS
jgi:hypothetical protein